MDLILSELNQIIILIQLDLMWSNLIQHNLLWSNLNQLDMIWIKLLKLVTKRDKQMSYWLQNIKSEQQEKNKNMANV